MLTAEARRLANSFVAALTVRDPDTAAHCRRVAAYALRLQDQRLRGKAHPLDNERAEVLEVGALLHDMGKLFIPDGILLARGSLTKEQRRAVEIHPLIGESILRHSDAMTEVLPIVRHHHERWDGTGYPDGLRGMAIPTLARIVAVCDVYDALTGHRTYRQPLLYHEARVILQGGCGSQFDPDVLSAWEQVPAADWHRLAQM